MLAKVVAGWENEGVNTARVLLVVGCVVAVAACRTGTALRDLDGPLFGHAGTTRFIVDTDRPLEARELAQMARVIRVYKTLGPAEVAEIERRMRRVVDDLVAVELGTMRPAMNKEKAALEVVHHREIAAVQADPTRCARLEAKHAAALLRIESEAMEVARARVLKRLGHELALPLRMNDQRSVVAIGRVVGGAVRVTAKAYEVDVAAGKLSTGTNVVGLDGKQAKVVGNGE